MLIGGVIDHKLGDHADAAGMCGTDKMAEVGQRAVIRMHFAGIR